MGVLSRASLVAEFLKSLHAETFSPTKWHMLGPQHPESDPPASARVLASPSYEVLQASGLEIDFGSPSASIDAQRPSTASQSGNQDALSLIDELLEADDGSADHNIPSSAVDEPLPGVSAVNREELRRQPT